MKNLSKAFLLVCFLGFCYSRAMGASALVSEIEREYKTFSGLRIPNVAEQPCMAVQYICYLQAHGGRDAAAKIALVIGSGVGVGGISNREATPAERALMVRGINFAVREKIQESGFNLELKDFSDHVGQHQKIVAQLIESSQRVQILVLKDVERNEMYY